MQRDRRRPLRRCRFILLLSAAIWAWHPASADVSVAEPSEPHGEGVTLSGSEIDSSSVEVGATAIVIYGLGQQDSATGEWRSLNETTGVIQAVNSRRLLLAVPENAVSQRIDLARIQTLILGRTSLPPSTVPDTIRAQTEPVDTLALMETRHPSGMENRRLRLVAKVAAGTVSAAVLGALTIGVQAARWEDTDPSTSSSGMEGLVFFVQGLLVGSMVGFPMGVTLVDPHDSFLVTLLGGATPGLAGIMMMAAGRGSAVSVIGGVVTLFGPIVGSLHASEKSRKRPRDRRVSLGLAPTLNGGLTPVARLRF